MSETFDFSEFEKTYKDGLRNLWLDKKDGSSLRKRWRGVMKRSTRLDTQRKENERGLDARRSTDTGLPDPDPEQKRAWERLKVMNKLRRERRETPKIVHIWSSNGAIRLKVRIDNNTMERWTT